MTQNDFTKEPLKEPPKSRKGWIRVFTIFVVVLAIAIWVAAVAYTLGYEVPGLRPPMKSMPVLPR